SAQLLASLTKTPTEATASAAASTPSEAPAAGAAEPVKGGKFAGTWTAHPDKDSTVLLKVTSDGGFTWKFTGNGNSHELAGQSSFADGVLTLVQAQGGPPLVGQVKWSDERSFVFQALGGGAGDPGLSFSRSS